MLRTDTAPAIQRSDYLPYPYAITEVELAFDLDPASTRVHARLRFQRKAQAPAPLVLAGQGLDLVSLHLDGQPLPAAGYTLAGETLSLTPERAEGTLEIVTTCQPAANTSLMGLYVSGDSLFTQCEPEGFRRITWFPDRPDVLSRYRVTLRGDGERYPMLLSNGNLVSERALPDGRREAVWEDPHPKPCYLFALVAGRFDCREQTITTRDGRQCLLQVYSDPGTRDQTAWALDCLARSVAWDEQRYGLSLDLDRFMIVAARDFNMGAMENKGLNIFNASYVLANPDSATDAAYRAVEAVIGHEYFHNWTGNRVTCRDWFQLSLKEGLTVFRDQSFSADMLAQGLDGPQADSERAVKRIDDVIRLRISQFPEDAGPMAHPIRPESYQEISNFYTATVYEKGAEVIRMQHTLLGAQAFHAGIDLYFARHDGAAVTCDDFVDAMETAYAQSRPGRDLSVFRRWYAQAGTPRVAVQTRHDAERQTFTLTLTQRNPAVGIEALRQPPAAKPPLQIPFAIGLLDRQGRALPLTVDGATAGTQVLSLEAETQSWTFPGLAEAPVVSLLRNFSAPVIVEVQRDDEELRLLARHDPDPFARWEAAQTLASRRLLDHMAGRQDPAAEQAFLDLWRELLASDSLGDSYKARLLALPDAKEVLMQSQPMRPLAVVAAERHWLARLGEALAEDWLACYARAQAGQGGYAPDPASAGRRALKHLALRHLAAAGHPRALPLALAQYAQADNLTDRLAALAALTRLPGAREERDRCLRDFYQRWQHDAAVIDKWFALQATAEGADVAAVRGLMAHPAFSLRNPNRARALVFQFCLNHLEGVHGEGGYDFWAEQVLALDALNPEVAARLARAFDNWTRFEPRHRDGIGAALRRLQAHEGLSRNVAEIVGKTLNV